MNQFPIQLAKVQAPALREETLARGRLLDWLHARIHDRVILVLADAVARTVVRPLELPVGAVTALVGVPLFALLLRRTYL